ncbi:hypothetical protein PspLS_05868 [Pyricularia sp. CBS 133598]|nr:hypothetical protein PspLS_05868 [Pyricularia sp. CBS 133598]
MARPFGGLALQHPCLGFSGDNIINQCGNESGGMTLTAGNLIKMVYISKDKDLERQHLLGSLAIDELLHLGGADKTSIDGVFVQGPIPGSEVTAVTVNEFELHVYLQIGTNIMAFSECIHKPEADWKADALSLPLA